MGRSPRVHTFGTLVAVNLEEYERMYRAEETQWWYAGMRSISLGLLAEVRRQLGLNGRLRILDAGCGTGNNLAHLARSGVALGIDLSDEALRFCRTRGVIVARAALLALPFPEASFDCVTSFDVLYHRWVTDDAAAVREMARVLKPGGLLLARVPALSLLWGAHDEAVHSRHRYTRREVRGLLERCGLVSVRASYCNSLLLPLLFLRRTLDRATGRHGSDVAFLPPPLERLFRGLLEIEAALVRRVSLPIGGSVVAVARKPSSDGPLEAGRYN
jgi:SAM-dependent methyltransferase